MLKKQASRNSAAWASRGPLYRRYLHLALVWAMLLGLCSQFVLGVGPLRAASSLSAGDVAVIGFTDNGTPDSFAFVTLAPITSGTNIYFTDNGWTGTQFRGASATDGDGNENLLKFTANADLPAGTIIRTSDSSANFTWTNDKSAIPGTTAGGFDFLALSQSGDQIYAFQGPDSNPLFNPTSQLFVADSTNGFENATSSTTGNIPPGLTLGTTAVTVNLTTGTYGINPTLLSGSHTQAEWLAIFANSANWQANPALPSGSITVGSGGTPQPDLTITLSASPEPVTLGGNLTYTLSVANNGTAAASGIAVDFTLPTGLSVVGTPGADNGFTYAGTTSGVASFTGGSLANGTTATLTVVVTPTALGNLSGGPATVDPANAIAESNETNNTAPAVNSTVVSATPTVRIHDIQGASHISPLVTGPINDVGNTYGSKVDNVPGIVTFVRSNGFFFQDPQPDNDPATSEGIFVFSTSASTIKVGDSVQVSGQVTEFRSGCTNSNCTATSSGWSNLTTTELSRVSKIVVLSSGNTLPAPVVIGTGGRVPPNQIIEDDVNGNVESTPNTFDPATDGLDFYESLEGMRVQLNNAVVVGPTARFGTSPTSNAEIYTVGDNGANAGPRSARGGVLAQANDFNPERVILEDISSRLPDTKVGDKFNGAIVGQIDYDFGNFKLYPSQALPTLVPSFLPKEVTSLIGGPGQLTIATFNVENLDPGDPQSKFDGLGAAIVNNLQSPAIISVEEIQDNNGPTDDGTVDATTTINKLIQSIQNAGGPTYSYRLINPVNDQDGGEPGGNIRQALFFRADLVSFVDIPGGDSTTATTVTNGPNGPEVSASPGRLDPTNPAFNSSRKPLVGEFLYNGQKLFVIGNHFNSKGGDQPLFGRFQPPTLVSEAQRVQQATIVKNFVQQILAADANANVVVLGDLNDFEFSNPLAVLDSTPLVDLNTKLAANDRYSYDYQGNSETLDHIMVSQNLARVAQIDSVHINSEYPDANRLSDHEPVVGAFNLNTRPLARDDAYKAQPDQPFVVSAANGLLSNDSGTPITIISNTNPSHGSLALNPDGSFTYTPQAGYTGPDSFKYTITDAAQLYRTNLPPLATIGGVAIRAGGYGSGLYAVPGSTDEFYGLTDRGPNVDGPNGTKIEPLPSFTPSIAKFKFVNGQAVLEATIPLKASDGTPYNGQVNSDASTGETITDLNGNVLPANPYGYDSEGLVALPDGSFWVSDEYGPFVTHFDASGKQIGRLSPFDGSLPAELQKRVVNRGMEGLTITPDGSTLVGVMQSALQQDDLNGFDAKKLTILRIVTYGLTTHAVHEYAYLLDNPATNKTSVSEITALSNTTFLVDERDGNYPPSSYKKLWKIDISNATDIGPASTVAGATYNGAGGGLLVNGQSLELLVKSQDTATAGATLLGAGITPVTKNLYLDVTAFLLSLDPSGAFFSHDKLEGVSVLNGGTKIVISNDNDFGISGVTGNSAPFQLVPKLSPVTGQQDEGEYLVIDLTRLPTATSTATVNLTLVGLIPPTVVTDPVSNITPTKATVSGTVNPNYSDTNYAFLVSTSATTCPASLTTFDGGPLTGGSVQPVSKNLTGLTPNTRYYYRLVASNVNGVACGDEKSFVTASDVTAFNIFTFKDTSLTSGGSTGKIGVGGNGAFTNDNLATGQPADQTNLYVDGTLSIKSSRVTGKILNNPNALEVTATQAYIQAVSQSWKNAGGTAVSPKYGGYQLTAGAGTTYFQLKGSELFNANNLTINAPAGATVILNIDGQADRMQYMGFSLKGGITRSNVVLNFYEATTVLFNGVTLDGTVIAPNAAVTFQSGGLRGTLVAQSLTGGSSRFEYYPLDPRVLPL